MSAASPLDTWQQKLEADLKGRPYAKLFWNTADHFAVPPLVTRADVADLPHLAATGLLRERRGWAIRELITAADPEVANRRARRALEQGADEIEICADALAHDARDPAPAPADVVDPDDRLAGWSAPGDGGIAIAAREAFDRALDGIDVATATVWFSAGEGAEALLAWHLRRADQLGVPRAALRGGLDVDPIARLTMRRVAMPDESRLLSRRASLERIFDQTARLVTGCAAACPGVRPLVVDGQLYHLAGAPPGLELGLTLAALVETARHLGARGVDVATLLAGASLRVQVGHELLPEIAKLRALRLAIARIAALFGHADAARAMHLLCVTSGRMRAEDYDQRGNLLRTTIASFAAVVGGADALITMPYDDDADDESAWRLSRNQQLLLRDEGHLGRVADPAGGSGAIELLTDQIGRKAWEVLQEIETEGGLVAAMQKGWVDEHLHTAELERQRNYDTRQKVIVGISRFADLELGGPVHGDADFDDDVSARLGAFDRWRDARDAAAARAACQRIADPSVDLVAALGDAGIDDASLGEIATATWPAEGTDFEHRFLPIAATDGYEFEHLRLWADAAIEAGEELPRVLLLPVGDVKMARARADFARDLFVVGGFPVEDPRHFADLDAAVARVRAAAPAVVVLCSDDASYPGLVDTLLAQLADDRPQVIVAGKPDEALAARLDGAIHLGMDVATFLRDLQVTLGVQATD